MSATIPIQIIDQSLLTPEGEQVPPENLSLIPVVCYYVAAKWCPSSRKFRDELESFYKTVNQPKKRLEIVYMSVDVREAEFKEQAASSPWLSTPFNTGVTRKFLTENGITLIPSLLLMRKEDGSIVKKDCRGDVHFKGANAYDEWVNLLTEIEKEKQSVHNDSMISKNLNKSTLSKKI